MPDTEPIAEAPTEGEEEPELPEGAILRPSKRPLIVQTTSRIRCPYCKTEHVRCTATRRERNMRYYQCLRCCNEETMDWSRFKVQIRDPIGSIEAADSE